jgi:two-component system sensor histidine kinase SenX3
VRLYDLTVTVVELLAAFLLGASAASGLAVAVAAARRPRSADSRTTSVPPAGRNLPDRALSALDVGVVIIDRDEQIVLANPVARRMMVLDADRLAVPLLTALVREVTDTGASSSVTVDLAAYRRGPDIVSYLVRATPLKGDGGRVTWVMLRFSDVTEARRLELVRRDFVANVSHELKTPVGALTLLAEAVQDAADDPVAVARFSERMQREAVRLGRLVQELIELSRLQGAEALPGDQLVAVDDLVSEAVDRSRMVAEQAGIQVVSRLEPGLRVRGNETQLTNAVANLVDNAVAYSPSRTRVSVTVRRSGSDQGWVEIAVADQGIGIADADLDRVFERFFRVDQARSRATGGTGLGLAIVKHIATNHGGSVSVWSVVGSGSTFTIRLPLADSASPTEHRAGDLQPVA